MSDIQVQRTNDSSVLSKRSASKLGYFKDEYLRCFASKLVRRAPLINRGYYLRVYMMRTVLQWFFNKHSLSDSNQQQHVQVVAIGSGFDTAPYRLSAMGHAHARTRYYELDFAEVLSRKQALVQGIPIAHPPHSHVLLPCDLRDSDGVINALTSNGFDTTLPTLFLAECVLQYLPPECSADLIRGTRELVADGPSSAIWAIFDQVYPSDTFGGVMTKMLTSQSSPILGAARWGTLSAQEARFRECGWERTSVTSLIDVNDALVRRDPEERERVRALETFDEHECWTETCRHYCLSMAATSSKRKNTAFPFVPPGTPREGDDAATFPDVKGSVSIDPIPRGCKFKAYGHTACAVDGGKVLLFGGHLNERRTSDVYVYDVNTECEVKVTTTGPTPAPRVHHSMAALSDDCVVVFGGRAAPDRPMGDTHLLNHKTWVWTTMVPSSTATSPAPRFRHASVSVPGVGVVVFGGTLTARTGECLDDVWVLQPHDISTGWVKKSTQAFEGGAVPCPRHSCAAVYIPEQHAIVIHGGMDSTQNVLRDTFVLDVTTWTWRHHATCPLPCLFSHTMTYMPSTREVMLIGGVSESIKYTERNANVLVIDAETLSQVRQVPGARESCLGTTLCKHTATYVPATDSVHILGGGFLCFSFGIHHHRGSVVRMRGNEIKDETRNQKAETGKQRSGITTLAAADVSEDMWLRSLYPAREPVLFRGLDIGSCVERWKDPQYLIANEGETQVSVHIPRNINHCAADEDVSRPQTRLDFVRKNFCYHTMPFKQVVQGCFLDAKPMYLRSVARNRGLADVWSNFPGIGQDFCIPSVLASTCRSGPMCTRYHQSVLRLNGRGVQLWTHYDTLDNILCQIVGEKRVVLYPPSQYMNLYMEGSTSRVVDIDTPDYNKYPRFRDAKASAVEFALRPGDVLFIPALWFHNVTATSGAISVNVFWRHLDAAEYDPKDTYGNRDLPSMVAAREAIVRSVRDVASSVPVEYRAFAVRQALDDIAKSLH
eukprot:PhM_4_TR18762/c0_g1_i1/m.4318/K15451/PPM2, LCMT2, TYW4; tRNA wybutosine-synthesizing protein 4